MAPLVSVLMPTFAQERFIRRAIDSLQRQSLVDWELLIIDDGSPDRTRQAVALCLGDRRISYQRLPHNVGLGAALNVGLDQASAPFIAYLPSDDVYYADHLLNLTACLDQHAHAVLAQAGLRHHYNRTAVDGVIPGELLQLVQVLHRRGSERWLEREELVTDDLERMFWNLLRSRGEFVASGRVSCEWVDHPLQRHKLIQEPVGGINRYRQYFQVGHPLRFHSTVGNRIDEVAQYERFRRRPDTPAAADGLRILLVGELAYNADRVLALEERGHRLFGLWMREPYWYNTVGPVPFGHVTEIDTTGARSLGDAIRAVRPDVIYALLNWQAVPFAHTVLCQNPGVPFVWHFKEGPFICLEKGTWDQLLDLYTRSDGQIYSSPEMYAWFQTVDPTLAEGPALILDGDLPKADWFTAERSPRLSQQAGEYHTVVPGRPIGLHPHSVAELAEQGVHLHFYGDFTHGQWRAWIDKALHLAPRHLHLHAHVEQQDWVREFSQYDAGWLHFFRSENQGELARANWDDLNYPARIATLAAAGLPLLQRANNNAIVATQTLARRLDVGLFFEDMADLAHQLHDERRVQQVRNHMWQHRSQFTFDCHADRLIEFLRGVVSRAAPA